MTLRELRNHRGQIAEVVRKHGGKPEVYVFGSVARGDSNPASDVDLLVELEPGRSLLDRAELQADLEQLLGIHVDTVSPKGIYWAIKDRVLAETVPL
jgi:predicted nucleotidyltransferase